jgi:hypothetical protein
MGCWFQGVVLTMASASLTNEVVNSWLQNQNVSVLGYTRLFLAKKQVASISFGNSLMPRVPFGGAHVFTVAVDTA